MNNVKMMSNIDWAKWSDGMRRYYKGKYDKLPNYTKEVVEIIHNLGYGKRYMIEEVKNG
jgi:hypothetical protein